MALLSAIMEKPHYENEMRAWWTNDGHRDEAVCSRGLMLWMEEERV